jgi:hypothetical protein
LRWSDPVLPSLKLWPTLVFLKDGHEVARAVRPTDTGAIAAGLDAVTRQARHCFVQALNSGNLNR